mmetsp:Transcript_28194/g.38778  ORF Transcript_28194/g.38778 Transcript_28194/m.38778 type:complete len:378 (-) Transcript_28194:42-1175(-)
MPKKSKSKSNNGKKASVKRKTPSVEDHLEMAADAIVEYELEVAANHYKSALALSPDNCSIMDALADLNIQLGLPSEALELLICSTTMAPTENPFKWLFLAQLQSGETALASYTTGIQILTANLEEQNDRVDVVKQQIAKAYCGIAELYLTDLCYEEAAEQSCEAAISAALAAHEGSLDACQALASLRISQCRRGEACAVMAQVADRVWGLRERYRARTIVEELQGQEEGEEMPEMEFLVATAKLLIECSQDDALFAERAAELLQDLLLDDDENIELWYLLGVVALSQQPRQTEQARYHLQTARDMMIAVKQQLLAGGEEASFPYEEQLRLVDEHLALLGEDQAVQPGEIEDEEWSTCDEKEAEEAQKASRMDDDPTS